MSRTTGRTLALLGLLQSRREWTGAELRARLEVSDRTLRRDIDDLRALGYGIEASPGVGGGYRLGAGAAVPPLTLSADEAVAIAVGLRAAALGAVTGLENASARALAKLEQSLSSATRHRITEVERAMVPLGGRADAVDMDVVVTVARAIGETRRLRVDYRRHDGTEVRRTVEPHRIVHTTSRWYLIAWAPEHQTWRTLRLDRLVPRLPLGETFTPHRIPDEELKRYTARSISAAPYPHRATLLMHAPASDVTRHFGPTVAEVTDRGDGTCVLVTGGRTAEEIALYIGLSGMDFEILDGDTLRTALTALVDRFTRASEPA
jgi:predicted DNA-binding transcriptional regulator YafY